MARPLLWLLLLSWLLSTESSAFACQTGTPVTMGVTPWLSSSHAEAWSRKLGRHLQQHCLLVTFRSNKDFVDYVEAARTGAYAFVDTPPHLAVHLMTQHDFAAIAQDRRGSGSVAFISRVEQPLTLADLHGKTLALPDPLGFVSLVAEQTLADLSVQARLRYIGRHDRVIAAVLQGEADAGAIFSPVLHSHHQRGHRPLHVITSLLPHQGIVLAHPETPESLRQQFRDSLLSFDPGDDTLAPAWEALTAAQLTALHTQMAPYAQRFAERLLDTQRQTDEH